MRLPAIRSRVPTDFRISILHRKTHCDFFRHLGLKFCKAPLAAAIIMVFAPIVLCLCSFFFEESKKCAVHT
jgi:hypothetical protein